MDDSEEEEETCPLCLEVLDETDKSVLLCQCEYQVRAPLADRTCLRRLGSLLTVPHTTPLSRRFACTALTTSRPSSTAYVRPAARRTRTSPRRSRPSTAPSKSHRAARALSPWRRPALAASRLAAAAAPAACPSPVVTTAPATAPSRAAASLRPARCVGSGSCLLPPLC